jgi:hypothetical protein
MTQKHIPPGSLATDKALTVVCVAALVLAVLDLLLAIVVQVGR